MDMILEFFAGFNSAELIGFFFTAFFGLVPGFRLFQWIKDQTGWQDQLAHYMVMGVSLAITASAMWLSRSLGLEGFEFTLENMLAFASTLYVASQVAYQRFKNG